jgi:hypothetical protein
LLLQLLAAAVAKKFVDPIPKREGIEVSIVPHDGENTLIKQCWQQWQDNRLWARVWGQRRGHVEQPRTAENKLCGLIEAVHDNEN